MFQACLMRTSCTSTLSFNQGDLVLSPGMDSWETNPELFVATVALTPFLEQVLRHVPQTSNVFTVYALGEARQSTIGSVQIELAELPDLSRVSPIAMNELTRHIANYYLSISPANSQALRSYFFSVQPCFSQVYRSCCHCSPSLLASRCFSDTGSVCFCTLSDSSLVCKAVAFTLWATTKTHLQ